MKNTVAVGICISVLTFAATVNGAQRTFVSAGSGSDSNSCARTAPCRSFATAMTFSDAGGEVIVLDSGGYGAVTIAQSVSIISPLGVYAGVSGFTGAAIEINSSSAYVSLRGLFLNGQGGTTGIKVTAASVTHIENVLVTGFFGNGIEVFDSAQTFIDDSIVRNCGAGSGIVVAPSAIVANVSVDHARLEFNGWGFTADSGAFATIRNTVVAGNTNNGIWFRNSGALPRTAGLIEDTMITHNDQSFSSGSNAGVLADNGAHVVARNTSVNRTPNGFWAKESPAGTEMTLDRCTASDNAQQGIVAGGAPGGTGTALLTVSNSLATNNGGNGIVAGTHGTVRAFSNTVTRNTFGINGQNGTFESLGHNSVRGNNTESLGTITSISTM